MKVTLLNRRKEYAHYQRLAKAYSKMEGLIEVINKKGIPDENERVISSDIQKVNSFSGSDKELTKLLKKTYTKTLTYLEQELSLVTKLHYQKTWMIYGMMAGLLFSTLIPSFFESATWVSISMSLSMGMLMGMLAGKNKDKVVEKAGRQLNLNPSF